MTTRHQLNNQHVSRHWIFVFFFHSLNSLSKHDGIFFMKTSSNRIQNSVWLPEPFAFRHSQANACKTKQKSYVFPPTINTFALVSASLGCGSLLLRYTRRETFLRCFRCAEPLSMLLSLCTVNRALRSAHFIFFICVRFVFLFYVVCSVARCSVCIKCWMSSSSSFFLFLFLHSQTV